MHLKGTQCKIILYPISMCSPFFVSIKSVCSLEVFLLTAAKIIVLLQVNYVLRDILHHCVQNIS